MKASPAKALAEALPPETLLDDRDERRAWSVGGRVPEAVAMPTTVDELAEILGRASEEGWPVVPAGAGSWLDGGGVVEEVGLVVSLRRMHSVCRYEPGDLTATVEAGLSVEDLQEAAGVHGQWLPQDPPGWREASMGGFVATGLAGPLVAGFGRPRDLLLGLTVVTGDGRILRPGGRVVKNVAGYDLVRLVAGSWGTLGVVAEASVRLFPRPQRDVTLLFRSPAPRGVVSVGRRLATAAVVPEALEILSPAPTAGGGEGAVLAARLLGSDDAASEKARLLREAAGTEPDGRLSGAASADFHAAASSTPPGTLSIRIALLPAGLAAGVEAAEAIRERARSRGLRARLSGHVTRGVLRVELEGAERSDPSGDAWAGLLGDLRGRIREEDGSLTVLRGPAPLARRLGSRGGSDGAIRLVKGLKEEFDPVGILAPGRLDLGGGAR